MKPLLLKNWKLQPVLALLLNVYQFLYNTEDDLDKMSKKGQDDSISKLTTVLDERLNFIHFSYEEGIFTSLINAYYVHCLWDNKLTEQDIRSKPELPFLHTPNT